MTAVKEKTEKQGYLISWGQRQRARELFIHLKALLFNSLVNKVSLEKLLLFLTYFYLLSIFILLLQQGIGLK